MIAVQKHLKVSCYIICLHVEASDRLIKEREESFSNSSDVVQVIRRYNGVLVGLNTVKDDLFK